MSQPLTQTDVDVLQDFVNDGDASGYWNYLEGLGYEYAAFAGGVVYRDTLSGVTSVAYTSAFANDLGIDLDANDWRDITKGVMAEDFSDRLDRWLTDPTLTDMPDVIHAENHRAPLENQNLPLTAWGADIPVRTAGWFADSV